MKKIYRAKLRTTPIERQEFVRRACGYGAIHLAREGDYAIVRVEIGKLWVPVIREHCDGSFSHIVEPVGIQSSIAEFFSKRTPLFEFSDHMDWVKSATRKFQSSDHTSEDTVCLDTAGNLIDSGRGFMEAEEENAYPVKVYSTRSPSDEEIV
jgi:hypothetical protein